MQLTCSGEPVSVEAEVTSTFCGANASPEDEHLLADIVAAVMRSWCGFRGDTDRKLQRFKQVRELGDVDGDEPRTPLGVSPKRERNRRLK